MMTTEMMAIPNSDDANLVAQSLTGNREAFGEIVARYQSLVCSLAYSSTGSLSQSEDLAQETFLAAGRHLSDLREADKLRAWLCRIARNLICDALREQGREPTYAGESLNSVPESAAPEPWPSEHAISEEEETILWRSLERIPQVYREPLVLFYREHRPIESVAADLGLSQDAVKQRLSRGRKLLHEQVLAFVEGALEHTNPGRLFTIGVMAALPAFAATATATAAGAAAVKSGTTAKAATAAGTLGALLSWGVFCFFSVLGFMAFCGGCLGYAMGRAARRSARQRQNLIPFWRALAVGFGVFVIPVLVASGMAPPAGWPPAMCRGMTLWLGLMCPLLAVSLIICIFKWWRDLPPSETDSAELEKASPRRLVTWVALGTAVPAFLFASSLFGIFFQSTWQNQAITATQAEKILITLIDRSQFLRNHDQV